MQELNKNELRFFLHEKAELDCVMRNKFCLRSFEVIIG